MLFSIAIILLSGVVVGCLLEKIKIPRIVGMIMIGIIIGPHCLDLIDESILRISSELRQIALVIILTRAGLSLDVASLKKIGRPALLMCCVPATFEIIGTTIFAPLLLGVTTFEALLLGSVLGAVSPAIIVPRMIKIKEEGYGSIKKIPELILAGASVDDVYVIVLFYAFLGLVENNSLSFILVALIPVSIILGILTGVITGIMIHILFKKRELSTVTKILIILSVSFLLVVLEEILKNTIPISSLLGIMALGIVILNKNKKDAEEIERGYKNIWYFFEIFLFVLVGVSVNIQYAASAGINIVVLLFIVLFFRVLGVQFCLIKTSLTFKEKAFCTIAYLPKATVQASIGGIALGRALACGDLVLTAAVVSILLTAPLGSILIDGLYKKLLDKNGDDSISEEY